MKQKTIVRLLSWLGQAGLFFGFLILWLVHFIELFP